jgi:hypothetical protein
LIEVGLPDGRVLVVNETDPAKAAQAARLFMQREAKAPQSGDEIRARREAMGTAEDVARSAGEGAVTGAANIAGVGRDISDVLGSAAQWLYRKTGLESPGDREKTYGAADVPDYLKGGRFSPSDETLNKLGVFAKEAAPLMRDPSGRDIRKVIEQAGVERYTPATTAGDYVKAGTQGVVEALALGGVGRGATAAQGTANLAKYGAAPAVAAEAAGKATEGSGAEPYARAGASLLTGGAMAARDAWRSGAGRAARTAVGDIDDATLTAAQRLQAEMAARGQRITAGEAIDTVAGGGTNVGTLERNVAGSVGGGATMRDFYAGRAADSERQFRDTTTAIRGGSGGIDPSQAATRFRDAAGARLREPIDDVNAATAPVYRQTEVLPLDPADVQRLSQSQIIRDALADVTGDAENWLVQGLPAGSVGVWHATMSRIDEMLANGAMNPRSTAAMTRARESINQALRRAEEFNTGVPASNFGAAQDAQRIVRESVVEPMQSRMIGQASRMNVADADSGVEAVRPMISPSGRAVAQGGAPQVREMVAGVAQSDPDAARRMVADILEGEFNAISRPKQGMPVDQFAAARAGSELAGNPERNARITAAIQALPGGNQAAVGWQNLMRWYQAQGARRPTGSETEFNKIMTEELKRGGPVNLDTVTNATSFWKKAVEDFRYSMNTGRLAEIVTSPDGVEQLARLAKLRNTSPAFTNQVLILLNGQASNRGEDLPN